jgi:hypothetical protein
MKVRDAYVRTGGDVSVTAYSPVTQKTYAMTCTGGGTTTCTGGNDASVSFSAEAQQSGGADAYSGGTPPVDEAPQITTSSADFCSTHDCIGSFSEGRGSIVQCADGTWSHSGGVQGACSWHGGEH